MKGRFPFCFMLVVYCGMSSDLGIAQPQTPSDGDTIKTYHVDEVIVSGTRTPMKIIDIPYSVERVSNVDYKYDRKVAANDALQGVPGLFMQSRYGNHDVRISIRGFGSRSNTGIRGVRILQDGIPESEPDGQTRIESIDFQNVGSIEIVKGNASSLYTNAPGGVINFVSDLEFPSTHVTQFNVIGSFGLHSNGFKAAYKSENTRFLTTYNYHSARGYRPHSEDYWHILNTSFETSLSERTQFRMFNYYVSGLIRLPGSLTKQQVDTDLYQANARDVSRDAKRISKKGRVSVQLALALDEERGNEIEFTGYGTIKYFERTARTYRIFNRHGIGASGRFTNNSTLGGHKNQFSIGGDLFFQTGPIEDYNNINGRKGDNLDVLTDETITNAGMYLQNSYSIINDVFTALFTARYDRVAFKARDQLLGVRSADRSFNRITPKLALNYKVTPRIAVYSSYGLGFDTPAGNELDNYPLSSNPTILLNPDLRPQSSRNFEIGIKGTHSPEEFGVFNRVSFDVTFFHSIIEDEIVPFEVFGDVFFRNAAQTNRTGLEFGADMEFVAGLRVKTSYTLSDFTYKHYIAQAIAQDTSGNLNEKNTRFDGNVVPSVPKHNLSVVVTYTRLLNDNLIGFAKTYVLSISGMYADDQNSELSRGYTVLGATLGLDMKFGSFNALVSGGVNNIANKKYIGFLNINSTTREFYEAGEPRNFFASITAGYSL
jgi:iron complex outermembrane receptor protein